MNANERNRIIRRASAKLTVAKDRMVTAKLLYDRAYSFVHKARAEFHMALALEVDESCASDKEEAS